MTRVHAGDGSLLAEYSHERRLYLPSNAIPPIVKQAFISAEDKNFYTHNGIDPEGIARAVVVLSRAASTSRAPRPSPSRWPRTSARPTSAPSTARSRRRCSSMRIEQAYSKERILELYLNEIYLGIGNYGVAAAALNYFDKSVERTDAGRGSLSRRPAQGAEQLQSLPQSRGRDRTAQLRHRAHGRERLCLARGRRRRQGGAAHRQSAHALAQHDGGRLFRRGSAARAERPLWRQEALRGRPVGAHDASIRRCS